jgi:hypothetical protein
MQVRNMITERHNLACSSKISTISKTGTSGSCFVSMGLGSSERLTMQKFSLVWITKAFNLEWLLNL